LLLALLKVNKGDQVQVAVMMQQGKGIAGRHLGYLIRR
jgi:hypothetical protein